MASFLMFAHPLSCSQDEFNASLKNALNSRNGSGEWPSSIPDLDASEIRQCVVGPSHLAFLTHDGRICRVSYQVDSASSTLSSPKHSDEDSNPTPSKKLVSATSASGPTSSSSGGSSSIYSSNAATSACNVSSSGETSQSHTFSLSGEGLSNLQGTNNLSGSLGRWASHRVTMNSTSSSSNATSTSNPLTMRATTRGRARILRAARGRAGTGWLSSRAVIPASAVPEELISQAQVVLQGKSRQTIIRELQKTSLDVNLAVNNLLSRDDDDEGEDGDEDSYMQESYFPGEDLMSIFEAGIPSDEPFVVQRDTIFPEDIIYSVNPTYSRDETRSTNRVTVQSSSSSANRDEGSSSRDLSSSCVRDRWWGMLLDRNEKSSSSLMKEKSTEKVKSTSKTTQRFGEVKWWSCIEESESVKFEQIASLYSELIAVSSDGYLHQWSWNDPLPQPTIKHKHSHKRAADLKLTDNEKVVKLSAWNIRASILTESGKLATWLDDTLAPVGHKLEHPLQTFGELKGVPITNLLTCDLYSAVQLSNGSIFWWGVFPFEQRKKILDKVKTKAKKSAIAGSSQIKAGTLVCIRSCPLYYPGAIGFTTVNGEPKVGELLDKAWTLTEKCRFKILEKKGSGSGNNTPKEKTPEPSPQKESVPIVGQKRKFLQIDDEKAVEDVEENWYLQDVIFLEDVRHVPVGEVLKVDGALAMVHFSPKVFSNNSDSKDKKKMSADEMLKESVIKRKDELQIVKWTTPPKMPECYQKTPKQLYISSTKILTMYLDNNGIHVVLKTSNGVRYSVYNLASGRPNPGGYIKQEPASFLLRTTPNSIRLHPSDAKSIVLLRDPNNCLYPIVKDNVGGIQNPLWINLSSVTCLATGRKKSQNKSKSLSQLALTLLVIEDNKTLQAIIASDLDSLKDLLEKAEQDSVFLEKMVASKCDGNRNIIHLCVNMSQPSSSSSTSPSKPLTRSSDVFPSSSRSEDMKIASLEEQLWPCYDGLDCLEVLLSSPVLSKHLKQLLAEKDAFGYTPFMSAVRTRAYPAALKIYNAASKLATNKEINLRNTDDFMSMIFPTGCDLDLSPLHMLCRNDLCSFTWTGTKHINQDIFECKTCGLVGPLCCCTQCAQVCHIGHECKLKRTSPTAYCDCWEKCPCKALLSGDQEKRKELLCKLVEETDLCSRPNEAGHHILLFLAQTIARQTSEQEQYPPSNRMASSAGGSGSKQRLSSSSRNNKPSSSQAPPLEQEQDNPKFSKTSLTFILKNWNALKSMIMFGCKNTGTRRANMLDDTIVTSTLLESDEIGTHLDTQKGTAYLDNFVHKLIVKCNSEFLDVLLQTILYKLQEETSSTEENVNVARRFIRSVIRIYVVLAACLGNNSAKRKSMTVTLTKCKHVFQSLNLVAAEEMAELSASLFAPVRMGVVYPSSPFMLGSAPDSTATSDDIFSTPPLPQRFSNQSARAVRFVEQPEVEETGNEEEQMETDGNLSQSQLTDAPEASNSNEMDIDLMAESDTDSEDSNNGDGQGDIQVSSSESRRMRSEGYYSTAEASETEGEEDEDEEEVEEEDDDDDDEDDDEDDGNETINNQNDSSEQRNGGTGENSTPHALQWAVRNNQSTTNILSSSSAAHITGSGLVLFDTNQLRRSAASASTDGSTTTSMFCTPSALARTYFMMIREISDLLSAKETCNTLPLGRVSLSEARDSVDGHLHSTWEWLWRVMEETEAKLRFGASLTAVSDLGYSNNQSQGSNSKSKSNRAGASGPASSNITNPLRALQDGRRKKRNGATLSSGSLDSPVARQEYLSYILSLMRSHHDEHADALPKLEVTSLRHVAYVLDAFIYYLRSKQCLDTSSPISKELSVDETRSKNKDESSNSLKDTPSKSTEFSNDDDEDEEIDDDVNTDIDDVSEDATSQSGETLGTFCSRFFRRSDSTLTLGHEPTDPFTTSLKEALPLADRPHLLNPTSRRDHLFGVKKQNLNTTTCPDPPLSMKLNSELSKNKVHSHLNQSSNTYLARWHMCLELFGRVFIDDVGSEPYSILDELGRFDVKETKFKREMEKLRNAHPKDLYLEGLDRSRTLLMQQSLRQLNSQFGRRLAGTTPFSVHKLKVSFKEEEGQGAGVVRSFYTAISNAFLADEKLPNLDNISSSSLSHQLRNRAKERERERRRNSGANLPTGMVPRVVRRNDRSDVENCPLSLDATPYVYNSDAEDGQNDDDFVDSSVPIHKRELGKRIYKKVYTTNPVHAGKVTGMLLELNPTQIIYFLSRENAFKEKVSEAVDLITGQSSSKKTTGTSSSSSEPSCSRIPNVLSAPSCLDENEDDDEEDNSPLFFQPGKPGYYSPRPGKNSAQRLDCFRNVGRIVGLCLLHNELSSLSFNRHVLKYLLGRPMSWHDLAFYDPTLYESLRQLMEDAKRPDSTDFFSSLDLTFYIQLPVEEGGRGVELVKGGLQVEVSPDNVMEYVKKYAEYRMYINCCKSLQAMRRGLHDVIPSTHLDGLTAEDMRLLLNGAGDINVQQLMNYTFFSDETGGEGQERLAKFKKWFWSVVENMTSKQKQDLVYFWTSSPAMPASAEGFQPMPSVTVKPANDHQLPTANTCISRLYVPLYSSKAILRNKFLMAIKIKVFGFV